MTVFLLKYRGTHIKKRKKPDLKLKYNIIIGLTLISYSFKSSLPTEGHLSMECTVL